MGEGISSTVEDQGGWRSRPVDPFGGGVCVSLLELASLMASATELLLRPVPQSLYFRFGKRTPLTEIVKADGTRPLGSEGLLR